MTVHVLVHGTWHGGRYWSRVRAALAASGGIVHMPTRTGLGEHVHLASPQK